MNAKFTALVIVLIIGVVYCGLSWWLVRDDLARTEAELDGLYSYLADNEGELSGTRTELSSTQTELGNTQDDLSSVNARLEAATAELADTQERLAAMESDALNLHNPTLREVLEFLDEDRTDQHEYIDDEYVCTHFAADVNANAEDEGIRCAFVDVRYADSAHAIVAFETVDEGLVYFEPITDDRVRPVIGRQYWKCVEPKPGFEYEKPPFDDTILDIVVIW